LTLERTKQLRKQGNAAQSTLDTAQADYDSAQADVTTAKAQLRTAQATKVQKEAALKSAQIDLDHTEIRSPIDGIVTERVVSVGQTVAASFSSPVLFNIAQDLTKIQIEASVDEADIGGVKQGDEANFTVDAYPDRHFSGKVDQVRLAPTTTNSVVTYTVIVLADNPDQALLPGMTANVEIITGKSADTLRIPNEALRFKAPDVWEAAARSGDGGQRGGFAGGSAASVLDNLPFTLTDAQKDGIKKDLAALQPARPAGGQRPGVGGPPPGAFGGGFGGGGFNRDAIRQQAQQRIKTVLARYLTDDQLQQATKVMDERARETTAQVWVMAADGRPERRFARLGITDNRYTAVLGGSLKDGDTVVTRAYQPTGK
jgi:HlyD family secretion protein